MGRRVNTRAYRGSTAGDRRPWLVVRTSDGRAEVVFDRDQPGLDVLPGGRYRARAEADLHRDLHNRGTSSRKEVAARG